MSNDDQVWKLIHDERARAADMQTAMSSIVGSRMPLGPPGSAPCSLRMALAALPSGHQSR